MAASTDHATKVRPERKYEDNVSDEETALLSHLFATIKANSEEIKDIFLPATGALATDEVGNPFWDGLEIKAEKPISRNVQAHPYVYYVVRQVMRVNKVTVVEPDISGNASFVI